MRSESMAMVNSLSLPFCNASRFCEMLALDSAFYDHSQTTNRVYRLGAHGTLISLVGLIAIFTMIGKSGLSSIYGIIFIMALAFFMLTFFISLHPDMGEGILISVFLEERLEEFKELRFPPDSVKKVYRDDIDYENNRVLKDGIQLKELFISDD